MKTIFSIYYHQKKFTVMTAWECECHRGHNPTYVRLNAHPRAGVQTHTWPGGASGATTNPTRTGGGFL